MAFLTWDNNYSVEINNIDIQHKKLVDLINQLHEAMKTGKAKEVLAKIIRELIDYTVYHFTLEENLMTQYKYPGLDEHLKEHAAFVNKVKTFQKDFEDGRSSVSIDILNFLRDWILKHIKGIDKKYTLFFKEKGL